MDREQERAWWADRLWWKDRLWARIRFLEGPPRPDPTGRPTILIAHIDGVEGAWMLALDVGSLVPGYRGNQDVRVQPITQEAVQLFTQQSTFLLHHGFDALAVGVIVPAPPVAYTDGSPS